MDIKDAAEYCGIGLKKAIVSDDIQKDLKQAQYYSNESVLEFIMLLCSDKEIIENTARIKQHESSINGRDSVPRKKAKLHTEIVSLTKRCKNILDSAPEEHKESDKSGKY